MDHLTNFDLLQLIDFDIMRILLAFHIFQPSVKYEHHQTFVYTISTERFKAKIVLPGHVKGNVKGIICLGVSFIANINLSCW